MPTLTAMEVGKKVQDFAKKLFEKSFESAVENTDELVTIDVEKGAEITDWIGSALIMQGSMMMLEQGCPPEIVLTRVMSCIESHRKAELREAAEDRASELIVAGK